MYPSVQCPKEPVFAPFHTARYEGSARIWIPSGGAASGVRDRLTQESVACRRFSLHYTARNLVGRGDVAVQATVRRS